MKLPSTFVKKTNNINAVIETPKGCAAKYNFDKETQLFKLKKILPEGLAFPFHFGFIPFTLAEDGDPVDVLVLMNEPLRKACKPFGHYRIFIAAGRCCCRGVIIIK